MHDFINRLKDLKEWNLEVYFAILIAIISISFSVIFAILSKIFNLSWQYYQRKTLEIFVDLEAYPSSVIKAATKY